MKTPANVCSNGDHGMQPDEKCEDCDSCMDCCDCEETDEELAYKAEDRAANMERKS